MSIEFDTKESGVFSQVELVPQISNVVVDPNANMLSPESVGADTPSTTPEVENGLQVLAPGKYQSPNFVTGKAGWSIDSDGNVEFNAGTFRGTVNIGSLNIPDSTTANSFHVDSVGNTWWGANVATGYTGASAYVLNTGIASFKNALMGGSNLQYQVGDGGIFSYGDGSDAAYTFSDQGTAPSGTTKTDNTAGATIFQLNRDIYCTTLTVNSTVTVDPNGYRIFCNTTLTINGKIKGDGLVGGAGGNGTDGTNIAGGGAGGAGSASSGLADGYLKGSLVGKAGGAGGAGGRNGAGSNGNNGVAGSTTTTNAIGGNSAAGATGGNAGNSAAGTATGGSGGSAGTVTASNVKLIANWHLATLLDITSTGATIKFDNCASSGGGGGGGGGGGSGGTVGGGGGGGGGGSGSSGRIIAIYAKSIVIGASGSITCNGGSGGVGGNGGNAFNPPVVDTSGGGGGAGGSGGNGGQLILVYNTLTNSGTLSANGGAGGAFGTGGNGFPASSHNGVNGSTGTTGVAGTVRQFQLSF